MPFPAVVDLDDIAAGRGGFKIQGEDAYDIAGISVSTAGDVNGDGIADLIVGAVGAGDDSGGYGIGAAYVVFGRNGGFASPVDLDTIAAGSGGFMILGQDIYGHTGLSVAAAGDVNGDGIDDVIVGHGFYFDDDDFIQGAAYVVFGRTGGLTSPVDLDDVAAGRGGFMLQSEGLDDRVGTSVSAAGDVNGDGIDDLIVGAPFNYGGSYSFTGAAYVVFGRTRGFASPVDLAGIAAGTGGFKIQAENSGDGAGISVSRAGDVNGDGIDDLIVGARFNDSGGDNAGAAYVVFGRTGGFATPVDLDAIAAGRGGFKIQGENAYDRAGRSVSAVGDVNGDGIDDLIVGAPYASINGDWTGAAYVVFGRTGGFTAVVDLDDIAAGRGGFKIQNEDAFNRYAGSSVSDAGDVNGDGVDDLIISGGGAAYVVFGRASGFTSPIDLDDIAAGRGGFKIQREGGGVGSVSAAGDVNGDGIDDLIVGAPGDDSGGYDAGAAYVIFGRRDALFTNGDDVRNLNDFDLSQFTLAQATRALAGDDIITLSNTQNVGLLFTGNAGDDSITGSSHADRIRGDAGSDTLLGRGGDDRLWGTEDGDVLDGGSGDDELNGGTDADVLRGGSGDDALFARDGADRAFGGSGDDIVHGGAGGDFLFGGSGDDTLIGGEDRDRLGGGAGADTFRFDFASHSRPGTVDRIDDFAPGDLIDLSRIDAVRGGADGAFEFIGGSGFTAAGQLRVFVSGGSTFLQGNTQGSGGAELLVALSGMQRIDAGDLVL
jgi:Ca2+-binding RTX toxin-like protein